MQQRVSAKNLEQIIMLNGMMLKLSLLRQEWDEDACFTILLVILASAVRQEK